MLLENMQHGGQMMWMWFHTHINDTLLFKNWWIRDVGSTILCFVVISQAFQICILSSFYLKRILAFHRTKEETWCSHLLNSSHYKHVLLHVFHAVVAYTLMLVFMTFSVWLCISLCLGLATGHFLFGNRRFTVVP
ncbi:unnamed protein product [Angiostrongylus costaricensis]|uniref:Copper transport protein n=1 Tax=Angiostrongylus costaricensis TaxID=334426 RepID=A0A0R3PGK8_ANGCS|nr:unnamed protein product [Angiostrongylus costaricensis]